MSNEPEPESERPFASNDEYTKSLEEVILKVNQHNIHLRHTLDEIACRADMMANWLRRYCGETSNDNVKEQVGRILKDWESVRM